MIVEIVIRKKRPAIEAVAVILLCIAAFIYYFA